MKVATERVEEVVIRLNPEEADALRVYLSHGPEDGSVEDNLWQLLHEELLG